MSTPARLESNRWAGLADSTFYLAATVVGRGAYFLALPVLVRVLAPAEFGRFDLALVAITLLATALLLGTDSAVAPDYARCAPDDRPRLRALFLASCQWPLVAAVAVLVMLGLVQLGGQLSAELVGAAWMVAACGLLTALENCVVGLLRWTTRARLAAVLMALTGALPLLGALAAAWSMPPATMPGMLAGYLAGHAVAAAVAAGAAHRVLGGLAGARPSIALAPLLRQSWTLGLASLAGPARRSIERILVLHVLGDAALAAYSVLARLAQVLEIALQSLGNGYYPRALRQLDMPEGRQLAVHALLLFFGISMAGVLVFAVLPGPLLAWLGGKAFVGDARLLAVTGAMASLAALPYCAGMGYFHRRRLALYAGMLLATAVASVLLGWAGMALAGNLAGWCLGLLAGAALGAVAFLHGSERLHPVGYRMLGVSGGVLALAALALLPLAT